MGWFKQLHMCLSWTILSAICVSCQDRELTSTLRSGNHACEGEEVVFNCAVRDSSGLQILVLAWSSDVYIGSGDLLQFTTENMLGTNDTSTIDGNVTATLTRNTIDSGVRILESTLRLVAVQASVVTCDVTSIGQVSTAFLISAVPKAPLNVEAAEVSNRDECIILVQWDPPINRVESNLDHYLVYVPSRNIMENESSAISVLQVPKCGDNIYIQVAAVNRFGCIGPNVDVLPRLLDRRTATTKGGSASTSNKPTTTTEGGSASTSSQLDVGATIGIIIAAIVLTFCITFGIFLCAICKCGSKGKRGPQVATSASQCNFADESENEMALIGNELNLLEDLRKLRGSDPKACLFDLYIALRSHLKRKSVNTTTEESSDSVVTSAMGALRAVLKKTQASIVKEALMNSLGELEEKEHENMQRVLDYLMAMIPDTSSIDNEIKRNVKELRDKAKSTSLKKALDNMIEKVYEAPPEEIEEILLRLCATLFENLLKLSPEQEDVLREFEIPFESLKEVERLLTVEFVKGLEKEGDDVKVKMLNTCVHKMPDGKEEGDYLVVDLGVSHVRVLLINIHKGRIRKQDPQLFSMDKKTKNSTSHEILWKFIVDCITRFMKDKKITKGLPIGFTFPFPVKQESLTSGKLVRWTRDFNASGAEGKDVVQLLKDAFDRGGVEVNVDVVALINDTTGILLAIGSEVPDCHIGLVLGDGANACCYMEGLDDVPNLKRDLTGYSQVIINTEWGAFGDDGKLTKLRNLYDTELDDKSSNPGEQFFEKMISDKYQGIIVCLVLKDLISKKVLFQGRSSPKFDEFEAFSANKLSNIDGWDIGECKNLFKDRFDIEASDQDCEVVRRVCEAVSTRAARLAATGIVALVKKIEKIDGCTVAVDGSLYQRLPEFRERMRVTMDELALGNDIKMKLSECGSSRGAAFAAAMAKLGPSSSLSPSPNIEVHH